MIIDLRGSQRNFLCAVLFSRAHPGDARSRVIVISSNHVALRDFVDHGYLRGRTCRGFRIKSDSRFALSRVDLSEAKDIYLFLNVENAAQTYLINIYYNI